MTGAAEPVSARGAPTREVPQHIYTLAYALTQRFSITHAQAVPIAYEIAAVMARMGFKQVRKGGEQLGDEDGK